MRTDDGELVTRTRAGDWSAFAELVDRYRDAVSGVAYHYLGNFEDVQDAAQEAFVQAYLHLTQLREPGKFAPWLRRIATTVCADLLRRRGDRLVSLDAEETLPAAIPAPEEDLERLAVRIVVREALGRLSDKTRLTATLFYINGYSHGEIADFLEVPVNTVRSRLQRAKRQLREEMAAMVTDVLHDGKPDPELTRRVVEEAMRQAGRALAANRPMEALAHYDEALATLEELPPGPERRSMEIDALGRKAGAARFPIGREESIQLYQRALSLAQESDDRLAQARLTEQLGLLYGEQGKKAEHFEKALELYRELHDARGQAECLMWLGMDQMVQKEMIAGKAYYEEALSLFEAARAQEWVAVCRGMLDVLAEVGEVRFPRLLCWNWTCDGLEKRAGVVAFRLQPGSSWTETRDDVPKALYIRSVFYQLSHLRKFLDPSVPVGGGWSGDSFSYSHQPLRTTVTVTSDSERVAVAAGTFERCLLTEQVTAESGLPDEASERQRRLNKEFLCGTRRAWYAPGVGLVQLQVRQAEGAEALIQLKEFSVQGGGEDYLPLAIGNAWTYGWADVPPEYVAKEAYRVAANEGDIWYLEHYGYLYKNP